MSFYQPFLQKHGQAQKSLPFTMPAYGLGQPIPPLVNYQSYAVEGYGKNAVVFACISTIATTATSARLQVMRRAKGQAEVWPDAPAQAVLDRPNEYQDQFAFQELYHTYLNIAGEAYIIQERQGKQTRKLWMPRPDLMHPVIARRDLLGYVYIGLDGDRIPFLPEEVRHIKLPNPYDAYQGLGRGLAPLAGAAIEVDVDNNATAMVKMFFKNAAVPFGLLKSKNILDDVEIKRIRARMKEQYTGEAAWWEMMILDADADYQQMGSEFKDMEFPALRGMTESRICAVFKVPPPLVGMMVGLQYSTYNNQKEMREKFWEDKLQPDNARLAAALSSALKTELGTDGYVGHDYGKVSALQENRREAVVRGNTIYVNRWGTMNEARREVGLPPRDDGDALMPAATFPTLPSLGKSRTHKSADLVEESDSGFEAKGAEFHKALDRVARAWELRFARAAANTFRDEGVRVRALARTHKASAPDWTAILKAILAYLDTTAHDAWTTTIRPLMDGLLNEQGQEWAAQLGISWDLSNPEVDRFIRNYVFKFAEALTDKTKDDLKAAIRQAEADGWSVTKLTDELQATYSGWSSDRAEMIARSETIRASNAGANEAYKQAGITKKQWYTARDERVCPFCGAMHEKIVGVEGNFADMGSTLRVGDQAMDMSYEAVGAPPLHPNCRCTILPVVED